MCRMLAIKRDGPEEVSLLLEALAKAAQHDVFDNMSSHADGWGVYAIGDQGALHYRSVTPAWEDPTYALIAKTAGSFKALIVHARMASRGEPKGSPLFSQPFLVQVNERYVALAHNGSVNKARLAEWLGFRVDLSYVTDSELLALAASKVDFSSAAELVERLREIVMKANATKGALNLLAMVVDPRSASVSLACLEEHPRVNEKYYAMFSFSRGYFKAFMSSTVAYYAGLIKSDLSVDSDYVNRCTPGEVVEA